MSAVDDIRNALDGLRPPAPGRERAVLIGTSAARSITAAVIAGRHHSVCLDQIGGVQLKPTLEFGGWEIRDCDSAGQWHDAEAA